MHITDDSIEEIISIFDNDICKIEADEVIQLGDLFDKNHPSPLELRFATQLVKRLVEKYKDVTLLAGNGSHEYCNNVAIIEYLKELGAKVTIADHFIEDNIYWGHHMLYESKLEYGSGKCGIKDLEQYKYSILAHQHNFQKFSDTIYHIGSMRYISWNEVTDEYKRVAILDNEKLEFIKLNSPIKMIDVHSISELPNINANYKVRLVISSFEQFKREINNISEYKDKFKEFKVHLDFTQPTKNIEVAKENKSKKLEEIISEGIARIKDEDVRKLLEENLR